MSPSKFIPISVIGIKVSESTKNQSELPAMVERSDIDSPMSNDSGVGHDMKAKYKVSEPDSGIPVPASPNSNMAASASDFVSEPNTPIEVKSEVENNHTEFSAVPGNTCRNEAPCLKSSRCSAIETLVETVATGKENNFSLDNAETASSSRDIGSSVKVSEDADLQETVVTGSALAASLLRTTNEEDAATEDQPAVSAVESELDSPMADSAATSDTKVGAMESSIPNDGEAHCIKGSPEAFSEVSAPTSILPLVDSGETIPRRSAEIECKDNGLVASTFSSESLEQTVGPTERI